ncbi:MAG: hypothetical protein KDK12_08740 [Rhodobacteraceae bacterium]|nr:hypothetical protein [Paracoccaceae bacterium]
MSCALAVALAGTAGAQSLTPDDIRAMVDRKLTQMNPYQELLNDPDPARSLAALEIMLESGDPTLVRMAMEFGLVSIDPVVRRTALEGYLATGPVLTIQFDGSAVRSPNYEIMARETAFSGSMDSARTGYWRIPIDRERRNGSCYMMAGLDGCFITVNPDGVYVSSAWNYMNGRGTLTPEGTIVGQASLRSVPGSVPFSIRLLE